MRDEFDRSSSRYRLAFAQAGRIGSADAKAGRQEQAQALEAGGEAAGAR